MGDTAVDVCCRPPCQEGKSMRNSPVSWKEPRRLWCSREASALTSAGEAAHVGTQEPRRFLQSTEGDVLKPLSGGMLLDLVLTNKEGLAGES